MSSSLRSALLAYLLNGTPLNVATLFLGPISAMRARVASLPALLRRPTRLLLRALGVILHAAGDFCTLVSDPMDPAPLPNAPAAAV